MSPNTSTPHEPRTRVYGGQTYLKEIITECIRAYVYHLVVFCGALWILELLFVCIINEGWQVNCSSSNYVYLKTHNVNLFIVRVETNDRE